MRHPVEDFFANTCSTVNDNVTICVGQTSTLSIPATNCLTSTWSYGGLSIGGLIIPLLPTLDATNGTIDVIGAIPGTTVLTLIGTQDNSGIFNGTCPGLTTTQEIEFSITIGPGPNANTATIIECPSAGNTALFDLTSVNGTVNGGSGLTVEWYQDMAATVPINTPNAFTSSTTTVYAVVVDGLCSSNPVAVQLIVSLPPTANGVSMIECASVGNNQAQFNLNSLILTITGNNAGNTVTFYTDAAGTNQINTPSSYVSTSTTIWAQVSDGTCTSALVPIVLQVFPQPNLIPNGVVTICEGNSVNLANMVSDINNTGLPITFHSSCPGNPGNVIPQVQVPGVGTNLFCASAGTNGCTSDVTLTVIVTPAGTPTLNTATVCEGDPLFDLTTIQDPLFNTGTWSGTGVSGTDFDPTGLNGDITLTFTPSGCGSAGTTIITVDPPATPSLGMAALCSTDGLFNLIDIQDPAYSAGSWSGNYVSGTDFDPSLATADETVTLSFTSSDPCVAVATTTIEITLSQTPVLSTAELCETDNALDLTTLEDPNFPGGLWTGQGVIGTEFNPTGLSGNITLTYTPLASPACVLETSTTVTVTNPVTPVLTTASVCFNETNFDLTSLEDPAYTGGTWSGPGVTGTNFDASSQTGTISLDYTANESCTNIASTSIDVLSAPTAINITEICDPTNSFYTVNFDIQGGDPSTYTVDGTLVGGTSFTSANINTGDVYTFTLTDANNCNPVTISGSFACNCTTEAGSMDLSSTLNLCDSTGFNIITSFNNDFVNDGNDTLNFVLHDSPTAVLGNIIAQSTDGFFTYPAGITPNTIYYISPIAGNDNGSGQVDNTDPCFAVAQGIPVVFNLPQVNFSLQNSEICEGDSIKIDIDIINNNVSANNPLFIDCIVVSGPTGTIQETVELTGDSTITVFDPLFVAGETVTVTFLNASLNGCTIDYGQTAVFTVDIIPPSIEDVTEILCPGGSIVVGGVTFDENISSGQINLAGQAFNGCDSIVNISLSFFSIDTLFRNDVLCTGSSIDVNGVTYDESNPSGTEILSGQAASGCDSIIVVDLTFLNAVTSELNPTLCFGESIDVNGTTYDSGNPTGSETFVGGSFLGCDSIVNINLAFLNENITDVFENLCLGDFIEVNGVIYDDINNSGTEVMTSVDGCDSTVNVTIFTFPVAESTLNDILCFEETRIINGNTYDVNTPNGVEILPGASIFGCDSVINVDFTFLPQVIDIVDLTLCENESLNINGTIYDINNPNGTELIPGGTTTGCDSIVQIDLNFELNASSLLDSTLCNDAFVIVNGNTYDSDNPLGTEILANTAFNGCDSIVNINLSFFPEATGNFATTICASDNIDINGTIFDQSNPSGTVILPGASVNGCDSILSVDISFYPSVAGVEILDICSDGSAVYNGTTYDVNNPAGVEILTGQGANGCDSTVNVSVNILPDAFENINQQLCTTDFIEVNGVIYDIDNPVGTEIFTNAAFNGCDSTVNINLSFYNEASSDLVFDICSDESVDYNGTTYDATNINGVEILTGASYLGCDSTVNIAVNILPDATNLIDDFLCEDESILVNGIVYDINNPFGTETLTDASFTGCDSIITIDLSFYPTAIGTVNEELPAGGSIIVNGTVYDESNTVGQEILENASVNGCDSIVNISITFIPEMNLITSTVAPLCPGDSTGKIIIEDVEDASLPVTAVITGPGLYTATEIIYFVPLELSGLESGDYTFNLIDAQGNTSSFIVTVDPAPNFFIDAGDDLTVELGQNAFIELFSNQDLNSINWSPSTFLDCTDCPSVIVNPEQNITYQITATSEDGCDANTSVSITVQNIKKIFVPNLFSPNNDGINDNFFVYAGSSVKQIEVMEIYDRWGNQVFIRNNFPPNDYAFGWDGKFLGKDMDNGVYAYYFVVEYLDGTKEIIKGEVSIVR